MLVIWAAPIYALVRLLSWALRCTLQQAPKQFKKALDTAKFVFNQLSSSLKQQEEQRQQQQKQQAKVKQEQAQVCGVLQYFASLSSCPAWLSVSAFLMNQRTD
jgi:small-conductance mechanosensitive channel